MDERIDDDLVEGPAFSTRDKVDADSIDVDSFDIDTRPPEHRAMPTAPHVSPSPQMQSGSRPSSDVGLMEPHAQSPAPHRQSVSEKLVRPHMRTWGARVLVFALVGLGLIGGFILPFPGDATRPNADSREAQTPVRLDAPISQPSDSLPVTDSDRAARTVTTGVATTSPPARTPTSTAEEDTGAPTTVLTPSPEEPLFRAAVNHLGAPVGGGRFALTLTLTSLSGESLELRTADAQIRTASGLIAPTVDNIVQLLPGERISVPLEYDIPAGANELHLVVNIGDNEVVVTV